MNIDGYDQTSPAAAEPEPDGDEPEMQGDGLHHHEIHEDEGGGFHSVHTFPDGRKDMADHVDYNEAKDKQDSDFGCSDGMEDGEDGGSDGDDSFGDDGEDSTNVAQSYGNKARK